MTSQQVLTVKGGDGGSPIRRIPIILLTGFLGSGKTTLLRRLLSYPAFGDTAVVVNELGAVGLDHHLMWQSHGTTLVLENGCICCSVRADLVSTLEELFWKRLHRQLPRFSRVVIETTGLADPRPIIRELFSHPLIAERYCLQSVLCTVDTLFGSQQLDSHPECLYQAGAADAVLLTKTDLCDKDALPLLESRVRQINPLAFVHRVENGNFGPAMLEECFLSPSHAQHGRASRLAEKGLKGFPSRVAADGSLPARDGGQLHHHRIRTGVIRFDKAWRLAEFEQSLRAALDHWGDRILRLKGLISEAGQSRPLAVQAVQKMIFPFERVDGLTGAGSANCIVCITLDLEIQALEDYFRPSSGSSVLAELADI